MFTKNIKMHQYRNFLIHAFMGMLNQNIIFLIEHEIQGDIIYLQLIIIKYIASRVFIKHASCTQCFHVLCLPRLSKRWKYYFLPFYSGIARGARLTFSFTQCAFVNSICLSLYFWTYYSMMVEMKKRRSNRTLTDQNVSVFW